MEVALLGPGNSSAAIEPGFSHSLANDQSLSAREVGLRWGGEGGRTRIPQLIPMEPPTQWNPCPVLVPHHIPVTVQRGQAGYKTLGKVALGQAGDPDPWPGVSEMNVFCMSPSQTLSSPELCLL